MELELIKESVTTCYKKIERRRLRNKKELGGWILLDHILWLDISHGDETSLYVADEVSNLMSLIDAISFHTHPSSDTQGKYGISAQDRAMAVAFGHEVVFTCDGAYLLLPEKTIKFEKVRKMQDSIEALALVEANLNMELAQEIMQREGNKAFKCKIVKIAH